MSEFNFYLPPSYLLKDIFNDISNENNNAITQNSFKKIPEAQKILTERQAGLDHDFEFLARTFSEMLLETLARIKKGESINLKEFDAGTIHINEDNLFSKNLKTTRQNCMHFFSQSQAWEDLQDDLEAKGFCKISLKIYPKELTLRVGFDQKPKK